MVLCGLCRLWQHAVCFALLREEDVPELHVCEQCSSEGEGEGQPCTDAFLQFLSPVALQVRVSVWGWDQVHDTSELVCVCVDLLLAKLHCTTLSFPLKTLRSLSGNVSLEASPTGLQ